MKLKLFKPKNKEVQPVKPHGSLNAVFLPERVREREDHIRVNDTYRRMLVVESLPEMITFAWFNRISAIPGVAISVYISPYSYEEASKRVGDYQTSIGAELIMCEKQMNTRRMGALNEKYDFFSALLTAVNLHRANIAAVTVTIMVTGNNYEEMHMRYRKVVDVLGNTKAVTLYRRQLEGLKAVLPTAQMVLPEYHDVTVANAACLSPLINLDFSHPSGIFFGINETGSPVFLDTFIGQPRLFGLHMFLTGMTRSGKSYTCKGLIARSLVHGIRTVVVDPEGEYTALAEALGGTCVRFHPNMECMFNVFDIEPEFNKEQGGYYIDIAAKQDDIVSLIAAMLELQTKEKLSAEERAIAGKAVRDEYLSRGINEDPESIYEHGGKETDEGVFVGKHYKEMPTISSYIKRLQEGGHKKLANIWIPFQKDGPQGYFDGQSINKFYDSPIVVFDISGLVSDFAKTYAMYVVISWIWEKFVKRNRQDRKRVLCDETWLFMKNENTAIFLSNLARRGAKYNTSLIVASQSFREFASEEGQVLLNQCDTKYFLKMQPSEAREMGKIFNLPAHVVDKIIGFSQGQGLLICGRESAIVRFKGFQFEEHFLTSNPEAVLSR